MGKNQQDIESDILMSWCNMVKRFRISPAATARTILASLDDYKPLSNEEERAIIRAIESTPVSNSVERMLAGLSRNTLEQLLANL